MPILVNVLRAVVGDRTTGPVFRQRRFSNGFLPPLAGKDIGVLHRELAARANRLESKADRCITRAERLRIARTVWRDLGGFRSDVIRNEFIDLTGRIGLAHVTAPKTLRHTFATILQDANVDPLIRNELMGHVPAISPAPGAGLGMTAVYTHTRPETKRRQLENALADRAVIDGEVKNGQTLGHIHLQPGGHPHTDQLVHGSGTGLHGANLWRPAMSVIHVLVPVAALLATAGVAGRPDGLLNHGSHHPFILNYRQKHGIFK